jgi:uncharacterized Zn finger protein
MMACRYCGGWLVRHGLVRYARGEAFIGVRYRCRECGRTLTHLSPAQDHHGRRVMNRTGRPYLDDVRFKGG